MKHPIDDLLQRLYRNSDDNLLQEFKTVETELEAEGAPSRTRKGSSAYGQN